MASALGSANNMQSVSWARAQAEEMRIFPEQITSALVPKSCSNSINSQLIFLVQSKSVNKNERMNPEN